VHFEIVHRAVCRFPDADAVGPQTLRLRPRTDGQQWLESFEMLIDPKPVALSHVIDAEGNVVSIVTPAEGSTQFEVSVRSRVETRVGNFLEAAVEGGRQSLPYSYPESQKWLLAPARHRSLRRSDDDPVHDFAERLRRNSDGAWSFLERLTVVLRDEFEHLTDDGETDRTSSDTLLCRRATSRELASLYIEASRAMGLAARFVSGYYAGQSEQLDPGLHAWAEVFLPGAGWLGFDPTIGQTVGESHIALAAAADPHNASVCSGCLEHGMEVAAESSVMVLERPVAGEPLADSGRRRA
jgi:transglutaminase-like putative cysteine protease